MIKSIANLIAIIVASVIIFAVVPASAQVSADLIWQDTPHQYHQWLSQIMKDMTDQMGQMTEQMRGGDLTPDQRQKMAQWMGRMSMMMRRISTLVTRPALKEADWQKQTKQMRKQMDEMMRDSRMSPHG